MPTTQRLFTDFTSSTRADWIAKIQKDLKGRPISDLDWHLTNDLTIHPFAHSEDLNETYPPIRQAGNKWDIGATVEIKSQDFKKANQQALTALSAGVNALWFCFDKYPTPEDLRILIKDIQLDCITSHFFKSRELTTPLPFLKNLRLLAQETGIVPSLLKGSVHIDQGTNLSNDHESIVELVSWTAENLPLFKTITIRPNEIDNPVESLSLALSQVNHSFKKLIKLNIKSSVLASQAQFMLPVGTNYFVEIAKIRALHLLWGNLLHAYKLPPIPATIHAVTTIDVQSDDQNKNKIKATTQAMSAIIGGVTSLNLAPSDTRGEESSDFNKRIAINVQHILQMESYFDKVADPAAGSYYIETLTNQIAEAAWSNTK